jgi:FkbM family methyltransferase
MINFLSKNLLKFFDSIYQKKILKILKYYLQKKKITVIDSGAHFGETILFLKKNFAIKKIYSFEPNKQDYLTLKYKFSKYKNVILFNFGLGSSRQIKKLKVVIGDSAASTYNNLNFRSKYFKKKALILNLDVENYYEEINTKIIPLEYIFKKFKINFVDYLKTDTEGFEFQVLKGLKNSIKKVKLIHFEHHYNNMLKKEYTFSDINRFLIKKNFIQVFKTKMFFRKCFEYIYLNRIYVSNYKT